MCFQFLILRAALFRISVLDWGFVLVKSRGNNLVATSSLLAELQHGSVNKVVAAGGLCILPLFLTVIINFFANRNFIQ